MKNREFPSDNHRPCTDTQPVYCNRDACRWVGKIFEVGVRRVAGEYRCLCPRCGGEVRLDRPHFLRADDIDGQGVMRYLRTR